RRTRTSRPGRAVSTPNGDDIAWRRIVHRRRGRRSRDCRLPGRRREAGGWATAYLAVSPLPKVDTGPGHRPETVSYRERITLRGRIIVWQETEGEPEKESRRGMHIEASAG